MSVAPQPYPYGSQATAPGPLREAPEWQRNFVVILTILYAATSLAYSMHSYDLSQLLTRVEWGMFAGEAEVASLDRRGQLIGLATLGLGVLLIIFVICWLYAARRNAEQYDGDDFRRDKGWAIGGWFCPVVNFWFPYQCMADVWTASTPHRPTNASYKHVRPTRLVLLWWLTLLGSNICSRVSAALYSNATTGSEFRESFWFDYLATAFDLVAAFCLVYLVLKVTSYQRHRFLQSRISHPYAWHQPQPYSY